MLCVIVITYLCNVFFFYPFIFLAPLSRSLPVVTHVRGHVPGPHSFLPTTARAFMFLVSIALQLFLPPSTRVESCLPTLLGALSSWSLFCIFAEKVESHCGGNRRADVKQNNRNLAFCLHDRSRKIPWPIGSKPTNQAHNYLRGRTSSGHLHHIRYLGNLIFLWRASVKKLLPKKVVSSPSLPAVGNLSQMS